MLSNWCDRHNGDVPIPDKDFLTSLVQETMILDVSGVVRQPKGRREVGPEPESIDSTATEMGKTELLALLEGADVEVDSVLPISLEHLEHDENVSDWIQLIREFLIQCGDDVLFSESVGQHLLPGGKA